MFFYIKLIVFLIAELCLWYIFGTIFSRIVKRIDEGRVEKVVSGFFVMNFLFSVIALVYKAIQVSLTSLIITWFTCVFAVVVVWLVFLYRERKSDKKKESVHPVVAAVLTVAAASLILLTWQNGVAESVYDDAYYIGDVATSVETDTISTHDAWTGKKLQEFNKSYFLENYETHCAVISKAFGVHPIIEMKYIQSAYIGILYVLILYLTGLLLCKKQKGKALLFVGTGVLFLLYEYGWVTQSAFYFTRGGEGKTLQALVLIPFCFYQMGRILYQEKSSGEWSMLFIFICAALEMNLSSMFLLASLVGIFFVVILIVKRKWIVLRNEILCMLPFLFFGGFYVCVTKNIITLYIR